MPRTPSMIALMLALMLAYLLSQPSYAGNIENNTVRINGQEVPVGAVGYDMGRNGSYRFSIAPEYQVNHIGTQLADMPTLQRKYEAIQSAAPLSPKALERLIELNTRNLNVKAHQTDGCDGYSFAFQARSRRLTVFNSAGEPLKALKGVTKAHCTGRSLFVKAAADSSHGSRRMRFYFFDDEQFWSSLASRGQEEFHFVSNVGFAPRTDSLSKIMLMRTEDGERPKLYHPRGLDMSKTVLKYDTTVRTMHILASEGGKDERRYYFVKRDGEIVSEATDLLDFIEIGPHDKKTNTSYIEGYVALIKGDRRGIEPRINDTLPEPYRSEPIDEDAPMIVTLTQKRGESVIFKSTQSIELEHLYIELQKLGPWPKLQFLGARYIDPSGQRKHFSYDTLHVRFQSRDRIEVYGCSDIMVGYDSSTKDFLVFRNGHETPILRAQTIIDIACRETGEVGILNYGRLKHPDLARPVNKDVRQLIVLNQDNSLAKLLELDVIDGPLTSISPASGSWWRISTPYKPENSYIIDIEREDIYHIDVPVNVSTNSTHNLMQTALLHPDFKKWGQDEVTLEQDFVAARGPSKVNSQRVKDTSILPKLKSSFSGQSPHNGLRDFLALFSMAGRGHRTQDRNYADDEWVTAFYADEGPVREHSFSSTQAPFDRVYMKWNRGKRNTREWLLFEHRQLEAPEHQSVMALTLAVRVTEDLSKPHTDPSRFNILKNNVRYRLEARKL